jgi:4'-phosphopantetheinyl transferase
VSSHRQPAPVLADGSWTPGPRRAVLADGVVHVWRAELALVHEGVEDLLCATERERAARVLHQRDRQLWMPARGVLRALLARYVHSGPAELRS